jgi:DNA primase
MISKNSIQEIITKSDIIDVVGNFIKLKKRGVNYLGNCPFHNEKSPSFTVSPAKEIYKCFGCGKSGNTVSFVMEHEKYSYVEALRWLAARYNIELEETEYSPEQKEQLQISDSLFIINNFAQQFFTNALLNTDDGKAIGYSYFKERDFDDNIIDRFKLGYAPEQRTALAQALLQNQFNKDLLLKTGLVVERDGQLIDNYRGRVVFPIHNQSGKVIGFGARILKTTDKAPKYINTPQNEIYDKSKTLYGLYYARTVIDKQDECMLVEGYTDVISLHQAGVENVVASGGTSLTIDQLRLIRKFTKNLTILYDGDGAGIKAALRGLDLALEQSFNVNVVLIPDGEDPDSYVKKVGKEAFIEFVKQNKQDVILFQLKVNLKEIGNDTVGKSNLVNQIAETISKINKTEDFTRQQDYIKQCSEVLKIDEGGLTNLVNKLIREKIAKKDYNTPITNEQNFESSIESNIIPDDATIDILLKDELQERNIARILIEFGNKPYHEKTVAQYLLNEALDLDFFENQQIIELINTYRAATVNDSNVEFQKLLSLVDPSLSSTIISLISFPYEVSNNWLVKYKIQTPSREEMYVEDLESSLLYLQLKKIKKMIEENLKEMEFAQSNDMMVLLETHKTLKQHEIELTQKLGTVIYK